MLRDKLNRMRRKSFRGLQVDRLKHVLHGISTSHGLT